MRRDHTIVIPMLMLAVLVSGPALAVQIEPAPPNRPDRPILPDKPPTPTTVDDNDSYGYCIVAGNNSIHCSPFNPSCVPLPTSLRVPKIPEAFDSAGWESSPNATPCGTKSCLLIFRCSCGALLLDRVCGV